MDSLADTRYTSLLNKDIVYRNILNTSNGSEIPSAKTIVDHIRCLDLIRPGRFLLAATAILTKKRVLLDLTHELKDTRWSDYIFYLPTL